ncbi:delta(3,5)-Delta(2,4)-dienoyl-CoA isomerase, mitochondrial [Bacillus rossius redtenbacheri]|uniref:delta(3,5)-Delta(2,4)-dienoyl-CoA isomerase, mitochondrial n=1 Tax=Bacillus rossius redtenbacheri TaxID=93214 RepID=UPI002FDEDF23
MSILRKISGQGIAAMKKTDLLLRARNCSNISKELNFETLSVKETRPFVFHVELNRPEKLNAMNRAMWCDIGKCFTALGDNPDCRVIVLSGAGKIFTAGLDFSDSSSLTSAFEEHADVARRCNALRKTIKLYQDSITSLEVCPKPVISAIHSACVGGGVDLVVAADIRLCSSDAWFQVKEVDIGMAADVGTLQRLPRVVGSDSLARELCYTARKMLAPEAKECGFVSRVCDSRESVVNAAITMATEIASKSPVAVQLTKRSIVYSRDHSVQEGLDHILDWNMTMLQSEDFMKAMMAQATKSPPPAFSKL